MHISHYDQAKGFTAFELKHTEHTDCVNDISSVVIPLIVLILHRHC